MHTLSITLTGSRSRTHTPMSGPAADDDAARAVDGAAPTAATAPAVGGAAPAATPHPCADPPARLRAAAARARRMAPGIGGEWVREAGAGVAAPLEEKKKKE